VAQLLSAAANANAIYRREGLTERREGGSWRACVRYAVGVGLQHLAWVGG